MPGEGSSTGYGHPVTGMLIGYARCSTDTQDLTTQRNALTALGVTPDRLYTDHGLTGTSRARPGLREALAACRSGDTLVVTKLDRLARSLPDARDIVAELTGAGVRPSRIRCALSSYSWRGRTRAGVTGASRANYLAWGTGWGRGRCADVAHARGAQRDHGRHRDQHDSPVEQGRRALPPQRRAQARGQSRLVRGLAEEYRAGVADQARPVRGDLQGMGPPVMLHGERALRPGHC
jgi:Resolvase, N terminal domain